MFLSNTILKMVDLNFCDNLALVTLILFILWISIKYIFTPKNLAPGPWGLPIIGYVPFLGPKPHVKIAGMRKKYGDIIRINLGGREMVFLNSYTAIKEALIKQADVFTIRPKNTTKVFQDYPGIIRSSGEIWADFRRFTLSTFRDFGFGKSSLEPKIIEEIQYFLNEIEHHNGQPSDISKSLQLSITNVICIIMTGTRYDYTNETFKNLLNLSDEHINRIGIDRITNFIPVRLRFPALIKFFGIKSSLITALEMIKLLTQIVDNFYKVHEPGNRNNFIDAWFSEAEKSGIKINHFTKQHLAGVLLDLFLAGSDTTTNSLTWGLLYMMEYPEIQKKIQEEIDEVIGKDRSPTMADQKLMPYTEATLMEISRCASIAPLALLHSTLRDTMLEEYLIRKNTLIAPNIWAVLHDPNIFPDCHIFKPERFLNNEKQVQKMEQLIPFSMGKRQCMGESLAKMEMFLYFTSMLQKFTFKNADGVQLNFDYDYALVTKPKPQKFCAILR